MKITCFFCGSPLVMAPDNSGGNFRVKVSESCKKCEADGNLDEVTSTYNDDGSFNWIHIFTDKQEYTTIMAGFPIPRPMYFRKNRSYHIRYHVETDTTDIMVLGDVDPIVSVPGQKIKPANAREKLSLYLLFS
jgi:hypothetical protein